MSKKKIPDDKKLKDPSFPLYANDFLLGTMGMDDAEVGAYIRMLCVQWDRGFLPKNAIEIAKIIGNKKKSIEGALVKFIPHENGGVFNKRLSIERWKRDEWLKVQKDNGCKGGRPPKPNDNPNESQDKPTGLNGFPPEKPNQNPTETSSSSLSSSSLSKERVHTPKQPKRNPKPFVPPSKQDMIDYFAANGYIASYAEHVWDYYNDGNWQDAGGKQVISWKQKVRGVWFKGEAEHMIVNNTGKEKPPTLKKNFIDGN